MLLSIELNIIYGSRSSATSQDGDSFSISGGCGGSTYSPQHLGCSHQSNESGFACSRGGPAGAALSPLQQVSEGAYVADTPGSNHSTLSLQSNLSDVKALENWGFDDDQVSISVHLLNVLVLTELNLSQIAVVRAVIYSTREDVNLVHELFRLAFHFPIQYHIALRKVLDVYNGWIHPSHQASKVSGQWTLSNIFNI